MNSGMLKDLIATDHWIAGDGSLVAPPLRPNRNWSEFLPPDELQAARGFEPYDCVIYGTLNAVEILLRAQYQFTDNYSDRYLAQISGTAIYHGNSPHTVAEYLRKRGVVYEELWPNTANSFEEYYQEPPAEVHAKAGDFLKHYAFNHDWVPNDPASMLNFLAYSPLGFTVPAWFPDENGLYYRPAGMTDNHFVVCYNAVEGQYWNVFDTYDSTHKRLRWDVRPELVKRYSIKLAAETQTWLDQAFDVISHFLNQLHNQSKTPMPRTKLIAFCDAIQRHEGWYPGSRSYRNHNPGNCRFSSVGYAAVYGKVGRDAQGFAIFKDDDTGYLYLKNLVKEKIRRNPNQTIYNFFDVYAPAEDHNNPKRYAEVVAAACSMKPTDTLQVLL